MRPCQIHVGAGGLRLLPVAALLAWQLIAAAPAHAQAGSLDPRFGKGGTVTTDFARRAEEAFAVAVQADGRIVAAGRTDEGNGSALGDWALARYRADGKLDKGFGRGGTVKLDFSGAGGDDRVNALAVQADGKLVAAGFAPSGWALARFGSDGMLDASFGVAGKVASPFSGEIRALALAAGGGIVAAGFIGSDFAVARYHPDGSLDSGFGTGGVVTTGFGDPFAEAHAVLVQADGKIVAAGHTATAAFALARYNPDGSLDSGFGIGGVVRTPFDGFFVEANGLVARADGRLVAAGSVLNNDFTSAFALAGYLADGTLDPTFGVDGKVTSDFAGSGAAAGLVLGADGKLVAAGSADPGTGSNLDFALARYLADGSLDPDFGVGGKVTTDFGAGGNDRANALALQADGKLVAAGAPNVSFGGQDFALARYKAD
jgi:uncharacterized delta-60 repeat protein